MTRGKAMRRSGTSFRTFLLVFGFAGAFWVAPGARMLSAQQTRPIEYIESSSPLPGGGVVTSVTMPGQVDVSASTAGGPGTLIETSGTQYHSVLQQGAVQTPGQSVLIAPSAPVQVAQAPPTYVQPGVVVQQPLAVPTWTQVPTLGVPQPLNQTLRPVYGTTTVWSPAHLANVQPPAATLPPSLVPGSVVASPGVVTGPAIAGSVAPVVATPQTVYTPLVRLQNMPANAYPGQGILGSPKLYVDGQPVRNLLRYLIIP